MAVSRPLMAARMPEYGPESCACTVWVGRI